MNFKEIPKSALVLGLAGAIPFFALAGARVWAGRRWPAFR